MSQNTADLRPYLLTPQEIRVIYAALDIAVLHADGDGHDVVVEIRDRFRTGDTA